MKRLYRTSIVAAGRLAVAKIKGTQQHLNLPPLTRMVTSRSFVNDKRASGFSVGPHERMGEITRGEENVDFQSIFRQKCGDPSEEMYYDLEFTGEVEKQYLDYLSKLDYIAFHRHIADFPRKRSEAEKKVIFERYAELYQRKYPSDEIKAIRFGYFKKNLDIIDELNTTPRRLGKYSIAKSTDRRHYYAPTGEAGKTQQQSGSFGSEPMLESHISYGVARKRPDPYLYRMWTVSGGAEVLDDCLYSHWRIILRYEDFFKLNQSSSPTPKKLLEVYRQTAAQVFGSVEEAKDKIYQYGAYSLDNYKKDHAWGYGRSTFDAHTYFGFRVKCCMRVSEKFRGCRGVTLILPDTALSVMMFSSA